MPHGDDPKYIHDTLVVTFKGFKMTMEVSGEFPNYAIFKELLKQIRRQLDDDERRQV